MSSTVRLTEMQTRELRTVAKQPVHMNHAPYRLDSTYECLADLGMLEWVGHAESPDAGWQATPAGRAWLDANP